MILSPDMLALARARRKTRITLPAEQPCHLTPGRTYQARTVNADWTAAELKDWATYCRTEQPTTARGVVAYLQAPIDAALTDPQPVQVTILDVRFSTLGHITQQDAQREGHRFLTQFRNRWEAQHGPWDDHTGVWAVTFAVGDLRDLFDYPRLLKARPGHAGALIDGSDVEEHQDYTDRPHLAMWAEPEAVDARTLERYASQAHEQARQTRAAERDAKPLTDRVLELAERARAGNRRAQRAMFVIEQQTKRAEKAA